jgi:hypothetical protein
MGGGFPSAVGGAGGLAAMAAVLSKTGEVASRGDDAAAMLKMATTAGCGGWSGGEGGAGVMHDDDEKRLAGRAGGLDDEDESEEVIDIEEKLAPLSREQLKELVASLIARHESIGDTVLELAMRPVDTSHVQHQITSLHVARGTAETFSDGLLPIADQAVAYARAGDYRNALALSEALCTNLLQVLPRTDPETALAPLWARIESAFEFSISKVRKR